MKYQYSISHIPGKSLVITNMLSCAPSSEATPGDLKAEVNAYLNEAIDTLPATDKC